MAPVSTGVEREVKLALDLGADLPDLRGVVAASVRQPEEHLRAVYFDTPDLRLWERGITLRHRTGEGARGKWTLKLPRPSSDDAVVRTELEWEGDEAVVPEEARHALAGIVRRASLQRCAELHTERIRFRLEQDGVAWAELANDVVTVVGGARDGQRFRQLELEFTSAGTARDTRAEAVLEALRQAGARPDPHPKVATVLGPPRNQPPRLRRKSSAAAVARHAVADGLGRLLDHECRLRASGLELDPEDVHQARVATRRLRSDLSTLGPLLDPLWVDHVRADLKWVGSVLGEVRDTDVLSAGLREGGAGDDLIRRLDEQRTRAVTAVTEMLGENRYMDLLDRLHAASLRPPLTSRARAAKKARRVLPPLVRRRWKAVRRDARRGGGHPSDEQLHQLRKRSKQLRYACELATPVAGKPARRTAKAAESLQTVLGEHHDAVVARQWLQESGSPDRAPLIELEDRRRKGTARQWRSKYRRLAKPGRRAWLKKAG
jgi:CHAD domain-containing protein